MGIIKKSRKKKKKMEKTIAILGTRGSGKTVFLSMLAWIGMGNLQNRPGTIANKLRPTIDFKSKYAQKRLTQTINMITSLNNANRRFPKGTTVLLSAPKNDEEALKAQADTLLIDLEIGFTAKEYENLSIEIKTYDVPGEELRGKIKEEENVNPLVEYILKDLYENSDYFMFLVDPEHKERTEQQALLTLLVSHIEEVRKKVKKKTPPKIAFILTKMDLHRELFDRPEEAIIEFAPNPYNLSIFKFGRENVKAFCSTSVGAIEYRTVEDPETGKPQVDPITGKIVRVIVPPPREQLNPKGLFEPLLWLFGIEYEQPKLEEPEPFPTENNDNIRQPTSKKTPNMSFNTTDELGLFPLQEEIIPTPKESNKLETKEKTKNKVTTDNEFEIAEDLDFIE